MELLNLSLTLTVQVALLADVEDTTLEDVAQYVATDCWAVVDEATLQACHRSWDVDIARLECHRSEPTLDVAVLWLLHISETCDE
jgi:hypothetical protein